MKNVLIALIASIVVSIAAWLIVNTTHGMFEATDVIALGRERGGFDAEMTAAYYQGEMKSAMASFAIWAGLLAGACGVIFSPKLNGSIVIPVVAGLALGAGAGALGGYVTLYHYNHFEIRDGAMMYWTIRLAMILAPIALAATTACALAMKSSKVVVDCIVGGLIAIVVTSVVVVGAMGSLTPLEGQAQLFFVSPVNRLLLIGAFSITFVLMVAISAMRAASKDSGEASETASSEPNADG